MALRQLASWRLSTRRSAGCRPTRPGSTVDDPTQRGRRTASCLHRPPNGRHGFPAAAGAAYAVYCISCCGQWLAAAGLAAAYSARPAAAAAAWALHFVLAALPALVMLTAPRPLAWLSSLGRRMPQLPLAGASALALIGLWLVGSAARL